MPFEAISDFILDQLFPFQTANKMLDRDQAIASTRMHSDLGGSEINGLLTASFADVPSARRVHLDGTNTSLMTRQVIVWYYTSDASTSIDWRLRNISDGTDLALGTLYTADTVVQEETVAITPAAGEKEYRLQIIGGDANNTIFAWGHIEQYAS